MSNPPNVVLSPGWHAGKPVAALLTSSVRTLKGDRTIATRVLAAPVARLAQHNAGIAEAEGKAGER